MFPKHGAKRGMPEEDVADEKNQEVSYFCSLACWFCVFPPLWVQSSVVRNGVLAFAIVL